MQGGSEDPKITALQGSPPRERQGRLRQEQSLVHVDVSQNWGGTFLGVPIIRTEVYWGLYWGPQIMGNPHVDVG